MSIRPNVDTRSHTPTLTFSLPTGMNAAVRATVRVGLYTGAKVYFVHEVIIASLPIYTLTNNLKFYLFLFQIKSPSPHTLVIKKDWCFLPLCIARVTRVWWMEGITSVLLPGRVCLWCYSWWGQLWGFFLTYQHFFSLILMCNQDGSLARLLLYPRQCSSVSHKVV